MTSTRFRLALAIVVVLCSAVGCAGSPTAPQPSESGGRFTRALVNRNGGPPDSASYSRALVNFNGEPDTTSVPDPAAPNAEP
jgi:hypothetical protein